RIGTIARLGRIWRQSLILGAGALLVIEGAITAGMMIVCSILMGKALQPVEMAIGTWKQSISTRSAYQRLDEMLKSAPPRGETLSLPPDRKSTRLNSSHVKI